jgi:hypothetical protein
VLVFSDVILSASKVLPERSDETMQTDSRIGRGVLDLRWILHAMLRRSFLRRIVLRSTRSSFRSMALDCLERMWTKLSHNVLNSTMS